MDEWLKKMWYIYIVKYYSVLKKNEMMPFEATWVEQKDTALSEIH